MALSKSTMDMCRQRAQPQQEQQSFVDKLPQRQGPTEFDIYKQGLQQASALGSMPDATAGVPDWMLKLQMHGDKFKDSAASALSAAKLFFGGGM
jgi:hypothetical protein